MHVGGIGEGLEVYRWLSRLGKRPKAFKAPVSDNPLIWRTVVEGGLTVCSSLRDTIVDSLLCRCRIGKIVVRSRGVVFMRV